MIDGTLYLSTPFNRVIALDPETGKKRWVFDPKVSLTRFNEVTCRGVAIWPSGPAKRRGERRIFVATVDARLIARDAATGRLAKDFGSGGQVDLTQGVRLVDRGDYQVTSPPAVDCDRCRQPDDRRVRPPARHSVCDVSRVPAHTERDVSAIRRPGER